jgi:protein-tyrosine phosphatase
MDATVTLVEGIVGHMRRGETVVVHCRGGLGRSGTIAACCLVATGRDPVEAIRMVRKARPGAVEVESQVDFVKRFARGRAV